MNPIANLEKSKILPLVTFQEEDQIVPLSRAVLKSGINCIEIAFRSNLAVKAISIAAKEQDLLVGAGTVITIDQAVEAVEAGARFIISPGLNPDVIDYCLEKGIAVIPGVGTPTEVTTAIGCGLTYLKFFPAEAFGGIKTLKAFNGPFPEAKFMPAGGVNQNNFLDYLALPQVFCCSGSWMVKSGAISSQDFLHIEQSCLQTKRLIAEKKR